MSRAGVAANRSRASTRAPMAQAQGSIALLIPSSTRSLSPCGAPGPRVRISSRDTEAIEGKRLAAEAEGGDLHEVAVGNLRCRVPFDGKGEIGFVHAQPVVDDPDEPAPAGLDRDLDRFRASVERVLDQFLDRRRRPLDHLARGDAVDGQGIETANRHGGADLASTIACRGRPKKAHHRHQGRRKEAQSTRNTT